MLASGSEFVERLGAFLSAIRSAGNHPYAIEIRNENWLRPSYFEMLARAEVGHVFNSWTKMPTIAAQLEAVGTAKLPRYVGRLLLQPGTRYEEAVEAGVPAYVFVNNRAEGCAPKTIEGILERLESEKKGGA